MSHRRDFIPTNDPPPENPFPNPVKPTDDDYSLVSAVNTDETESPRKKTRGSPSSSSEIGKPFFKTKLCCNFRAGNCPYVASTCHFAHTVESVRPYKAKHCRKFYSGERCPYGESCVFIHDEASRDRESFAISLGPRDGDVGNVVVAPNWKTRICNKWEISGFCPFGTNCHFAHGASELHRLGGGLVEEEVKIGTSSTLETKKTGQADTVTSLVSPGVLSQRASNVVTQKPNGVRVLRKWKEPDKISRVYGDWIDDIE